ncbi:hypothetical protein [Leifsonia sp. NPDC058248]|uniref:hypothetical protein n=1 Tax=Leifsonia sp. NPDC058248 TaxID=3346402 RepID=UPI0036D9A4B0
MKLKVFGGTEGAAEYGIGAEIDPLDAIGDGYRVWIDGDGWWRGDPLIGRCRWNAWWAKPELPRPDWADVADARLSTRRWVHTPMTAIVLGSWVLPARMSSEDILQPGQVDSVVGVGQSAQVTVNGWIDHHGNPLGPIPIDDLVAVQAADSTLTMKESGQ